MFDQLQNKLQDIYEIETVHRATDFITSNQALLRTMGENNFSTNESVFISQFEDNIDISIFLESNIIENLNNPNISKLDINDLCHALEGISHFLYLIYHAEHDRQVKFIELELQAEIDKFIYLVQSQTVDNDTNSHFQLHQWLFEKFLFRENLSREEISRYKDANYYAAKYCLELIKRFEQCPDWLSINRELRRFYRLPLQNKLQYINRA